MVRGERIPSKATLSSPFLLEGLGGGSLFSPAFWRFGCFSKSKIAQAEYKAKTRFQALLRRSRFSSEAQRSLSVWKSFVPFDDAKVGNKKLTCRHIRQHVSFTSNLRQNRVSYVSFTSESTVLGYPNKHRTTHPKDYYPYHNMVQTCLHNPDSGQSY